MVTRRTLNRRIALRRQKIALTMLGAAFAIGTTGCTNGANSAITDDGATTSSQITAPPEPVPVSPIDEYLNLVWGTNFSPEAQIQRWENEHNRTEELIAACMADLGFTYYPEVGTMTSVVTSGNDWLINDPEWVGTWGFGVVMWPGVPSGGIDGQIGDLTGPRRNAEHRDSLSTAERTAHERALWGASNPYHSGMWFGAPPADAVYDPEAAAEFDADPANWGCQRRAVEQMIAESPRGLRESDEFMPLFDAIEQFREQLTLSATEADRDWATCMHDAGFAEFDRRPDFDALFRDEAFRLSQEIVNSGRITQVSRIPLQRWDAPEMETLFQQEIDTALADLDCRTATNWNTRQQAAVFELEAQFVADHQAQFNALRAAVEQLS